MNRAIVTYFDGDPFTLNAWLTLYEKYWSAECSKVYVSLFNNPSIPEDVMAFNKKILSDFPNIEYELTNDQIPETANQNTIRKVTEDYIGLIESDGYIYSHGLVDQCFRLLENEGQDIVAPHWQLILEPYFNGDLSSKGFMRCFFFSKRDLLEKTDCDFMPHTIPANTKLTPKYSTGASIDLDCFGWMSWQLLLLTRKITYVPANVLHPDTILSQNNNYKWLHVRQMSSSALGNGGKEFSIWASGNKPKIIERVFGIFDEGFPDGPAEFTYMKAIAFKLLFWDLLKNIQSFEQFAKDYRQVLETVIDYYALPKEKIYEIKGYYRGLFNI